ncbi:Uncharacterized protein TCM_024150 [Theobroma cacao]|uniref:Uncharacterized protein n=1 Tax=Theobroma cacao TaxID=3641 RepID=A0A061EW43_THECC|nr:Uncharacterized protein TCM_024150 [Theobroma cacao]
MMKWYCDEMPISFPNRITALERDGRLDGQTKFGPKQRRKTMERKETRVVRKGVKQRYTMDEEVNAHFAAPEASIAAEALATQSWDDD